MSTSNEKVAKFDCCQCGEPNQGRFRDYVTCPMCGHVEEMHEDHRFRHEASAVDAFGRLAQ
jgi:predicted RNA-binding Zn-ribbon protein involved in translation (DUF1610 family)